MKVYGKSDIKTKYFKDLKFGDVFSFIKDIDSQNYNTKIYIRGGHTTNDKTALNLETGIMYGFDNSEPVILLNSTLKIES